MRKLLGKREFLIKFNKLSRCHNLHGLIQRSYSKYFQFEISCPSRTPPCNHTLVHVIAPQFLYILLHIAFLLCILPILIIVDHAACCRSQMMSKCGKNKKVAHGVIAKCVTDVLTAIWRLLWSIAEQMHRNMESICVI